MFWSRKEKNLLKSELLHVIQNDDLQTFVNHPSFDQKLLNSSNLSFDIEPNKEYIAHENVSLVHIVAYYDAVNIFIFLVQNCDQRVDASTMENLNPLHYACTNNALEVASYILSVNPKMAQTITDTTFQYIYYCVCGNAPDILQLLVNNGADPSAPENKAGDPVKMSIKWRRMRVLIILLKYYKKTNIYSPHNLRGNKTPLMYAILNNLDEAVPFLLESGFRPDEISGTDTALSIACFASMNLDTIRLLCQYSKQIDLPQTMHINSAVHWICQSCNPDIVRIVLQYPIDVNRTNHKGQFGPELFQEKDSENPYAEEKNLEILEMLFQHNFDITNHHDNGVPWYDIFLGMINPPIKIISWCIKKGVNIDLPTNSREGKTIREVLKRSRFSYALKNQYNIVID